MTWLGSFLLKVGASRFGRLLLFGDCAAGSVACFGPHFGAHTGNDSTNPTIMRTLARALKDNAMEKLSPGSAQGS